MHIHAFKGHTITYIWGPPMSLLERQMDEIVDSFRFQRRERYVRVKIHAVLQPCDDDSDDGLPDHRHGHLHLGHVRSLGLTGGQK